MVLLVNSSVTTYGSIMRPCVAARCPCMSVAPSLINFLPLSPSPPIHVPREGGKETDGGTGIYFLRKWVSRLQYGKSGGVGREGGNPISKRTGKRLSWGHRRDWEVTQPIIERRRPGHLISVSGSKQEQTLFKDLRPGGKLQKYTWDEKNCAMDPTPNWNVIGEILT